MTDDTNLPAERGAPNTTMYRPAVDGGLEGVPKDAGDYREQLRSPRWNAAPLENPEAERTDPRLAVAAIAILAAFTLAVLVLGYGTGFWG